MVFSLGTIFLSGEEIILCKRYNAQRCAEIGTNEVTLQYKLRHFQTSEKPKTANLTNAIYKLMHFSLKYGKKNSTRLRILMKRWTNLCFGLLFICFAVFSPLNLLIMYDK